MDIPQQRQLIYIGSSERDLEKLPKEVKDTFVFGLFQALSGKKHTNAKPLHGFGGASVLEIVEDHRSGTYRAVYTVRFKRAVYLLHVFQKKSKKGIATPK
ncbi:MAG TPA: type II toxin-antitoxin system RelE/ParE family toxin, partial [Chlamydiales bacterium]|nr:type II toxin-antitoxin system RelE/ParE family toxin [Chlamydiales bacterium]